MSYPVHQNLELIYSLGTQVVTLIEIKDSRGTLLYPRGTVGRVIQAPLDLNHSYRVRFSGGAEVPLKAGELVMLALFKEGSIGREDLSGELLEVNPFTDRIIYRCIIGSRAYGLQNDESDTDYRGVFLPTANQHWSLFGVPDQIDLSPSQEQYWELQKFLILALKANPNILECLYSPLVVAATALGDELRGMREAFLSKLVYQTYNGYVLSQFKKMQADLRNQGQVKWKHVMHLLRLLKSGIHVLNQGEVCVAVGTDRDHLIDIRNGKIPWESTEAWRLQLHREFELAFASTCLPERPDYDRANAFLVKARHLALGETLP